jgi:HlyD family secretion protein
MTTDQVKDKDAGGLDRLLGAGHHRAAWRRPLPWMLLVGALVAGAGLWGWQQRQAAAAQPTYVTQPVQRGALALTVTANGTLKPTRAVNIGSELSGTVRKVLVDVNDRVKTGQVLVELDTAKFNDQVNRSRAAVAAARASLTQAKATVQESAAALARFEEVSRLSGGRVPSASELDAARAALARAKANEASAQAGVTQAQATLATDQTNLSKASIRSPIDGVVLSRSVDPGNAVAASLQAVTLFTIGEDLTQMRLEAGVDEADVGTLQAGQRASFTVSAYPSRRYPATVTRVSYGSTVTDNVVTYVATLDVDNRDLSLRPGMTAVATITATRRDDALLVPNAALRFKPAAGGDDAPAARSAAASGGIVAQLMPRGRMGQRRGGGGGGGNAVAPGQQREVYVLRDGKPVAVAVRTGISDGRMTEVTGDGVAEGMVVIVDQRSGAAS